MSDVFANLAEAPKGIPTTAIYSKGDGVVAWQACVEKKSVSTDNIEVYASHCGLGVNPSVFFAVADRLALPEREWQPFHDPKNLSASIAIEAAELMEHFQWLRSDELAKLGDNPALLAKVREEIADVLAYVLSFANAMNIDLSSALSDKMRRNAEKYPADVFRGRFKRD